MNDYTIKSVIKKIYSIDYSNISLEDNTELIISRNTNDFHQLLFMDDDINNIYLIPRFESNLKSVQTGLFYKENSFYNHPTYGDPLISFKLTLSGIKQNSMYRIRFVVEKIDHYLDGVSNKLYVVADGQDVLYNKEIKKNETIEYIHASNSTMLDLAITIGKIIIKDIVVEEVEVFEKVECTKNNTTIPDLSLLKAYAVFKPKMITIGDKKIEKYPLVRGIGLNILHDTETDRVIIERNMNNDVLKDNINNFKYFVKVSVLNGGNISDIRVMEGAAPFGNSNGYYSFNLSKATDNTLVYILIYELL